MGLSDEEYERIRVLLGRDPNYVELGMFSVMWSEHCSYKNTRAVLRGLPTSGPQAAGAGRERRDCRRRRTDWLSSSKSRAITTPQRSSPTRARPPAWRHHQGHLHHGRPTHRIPRLSVAGRSRNGRARRLSFGDSGRHFGIWKRRGHPHRRGPDDVSSLIKSIRWSMPCAWVSCAMKISSAALPRASAIPLW